MSDCTRFALMLSARPGELSPPEEAAFHAHLAGCDACQARLADDRAVDGLVGQALLAEAARVDFAPFVDQVMARVEPHRLRRLFRWARRHKVVTALAGLAPTLAALGLILYSQSGDIVPQAGDVEVISGGGGRGPVVLTTEDGPVVLLGEPAEPEGS
jgi:anti-sigma factor RsiW